jgi:DNA-binding LacI/PurR family transcriptional regulator
MQDGRRGTRTPYVRELAPGPRITDVAAQAGVAPSTVSAVLNNNRAVSEATRARVERSIRELNYKRHASARSLRAGRTNIIALDDPFYDWSPGAVHTRYVYGHMPYVYGVLEAARRHGWNVILVAVRSGATALEEAVDSKMVDGVILLEVRDGDERLKAVEQRPVPAVAIGMPLQPTTVPFVDFDFDSAGRLSVEHLVRLGHRRIGLLASPPGTFEKGLAYARRLWHSIETTLQQAGLPFHGLPMEPDRDGVLKTLDLLFEEEPATSALIVNNEGMIDVLMQALQERHKAVPADISVVAVGWSWLTKHVTPPLAHVDVPALEMGREAIDLLARGGPSKLLPATLVEGGTLAPPRALVRPSRGLPKRRLPPEVT